MVDAEEEHAAVPRRVGLRVLALEDVEARRGDGRHVRETAGTLFARGHAGLANVGAVKDEPRHIGDVVVVRVLPEVTSAESKQELRRHDVVGDARERPVRRFRALRIVRRRAIRSVQSRQLAIRLAPAVIERDTGAQLVAHLHRLIRREVLHFLFLGLRNRDRVGVSAARCAGGALDRRKRRLVRTEEPSLISHDRPTDGAAGLKAAIVVLRISPIFGRV